MRQQSGGGGALPAALGGNPALGGARGWHPGKRNPIAGAVKPSGTWHCNREAKSGFWRGKARSFREKCNSTTAAEGTVADAALTGGAGSTRAPAHLAFRPTPPSGGFAAGSPSAARRAEARPAASGGTPAPSTGVWFRSAPAHVNETGRTKKPRGRAGRGEAEGRTPAQRTQRDGAAPSLSAHLLPSQSAGRAQPVGPARLGTCALGLTANAKGKGRQGHAGPPCAPSSLARIHGRWGAHTRLQTEPSRPHVFPSPRSCGKHLQTTGGARAPGTRG